MDTEVENNNHSPLKGERCYSPSVHDATFINVVNADGPGAAVVC